MSERNRTARRPKEASHVYEGAAQNGDHAANPSLRGFGAEDQTRSGRNLNALAYDWRISLPVPRGDIAGLFSGNSDVTSEPTGCKNVRPRDITPRPHVQVRTHQGSDRCSVNTTDSLWVTLHRPSASPPLPYNQPKPPAPGIATDSTPTHPPGRYNPSGCTLHPLYRQKSITRPPFTGS